MHERVLAKGCLPVHSIFFALLKGKVKDNTVLNMFRCFVTRGSYGKPEFSNWNGKERTKRHVCAFCLLSVTFKHFLNTWGMTQWGAVGGFYFQWRQFLSLGFFLMPSYKGDLGRPKVNDTHWSSKALAHPLRWLDQKEQWRHSRFLS